MTTRSRRETIHFRHSFHLKGVDRPLPAGAYEVVTDEEMIEGLSCASYRREERPQVASSGQVGSAVLGVGVQPLEFLDARLHEHESALVALLTGQLLAALLELLLTGQEQIEPRHELDEEDDEDVEQQRDDDDVARRESPANYLLVLVALLEVEVNQRPRNEL